MENHILSREERENLATFTHKGSVNAYKKEGLTESETTIVAKYFTDKSGPLLDIGCGAGRTTAPLKTTGFDVYGIDLSGAMIREARSSYPALPFMVMNACCLGFRSGTFSNVLFSFNGIDCIFPYEKRLACLREIHRVLKPGGVLAYSSHNALWIPRNRIGWGIIKENLLEGKLFSHYRKERDPYGILFLYYGIPFIETRTLRSLGYIFTGIEGRSHSGIRGVLFNECSPYFIAKKHE